jgi:alpha-mannosidase
MNLKKEIFLAPYAHLDTQWRWEFPTTINKFIKNTMDENFRLFEKYPEYRFNFTGAIRYAFMKEYYPENFEKVRRYIEQGKWALAGTCLDETDTLIPSVESMIRNILYGDRWYKNEFGLTSRDYMIPDCFGFPANMPTVLRHCSIHGFSTQKLTWNSAVGIPFELGFWKGPDGSRLISALNPGSYVSYIIPPVHLNRGRLKRLKMLGEKNGIWKSLQYYGVGDIGGAPSEGSVKRALSSIHYSKNDIEVRQGSQDEFFSEITDDEKKRMDYYEGDLLLVNHSAGSLSSAAIMKRWNRKNEQLAFAAEAAAVIAKFIVGTPYPTEKIQSAWYRTIGNQMHDILPGTCTPTAYMYSQNDEIIALNTWNVVLEDSAASIVPFVKGNGTILLFNPLGEFRTDAVDIELPNCDNTNHYFIILDSEGNSVPTQVQKTNDKVKLTFVPELKPLSWSRYSVSQEEKDRNNSVLNAVSVKLQKDCYILENSMYRVEILENGTIKSIFHKKIEKELLNKPLAYEFQSEKPKIFPAWNMDWKDRKKEPFLRLETASEVMIIENGSIRCTVQITTHYNKSTFVKEISLSHESPIVEFTERIDWKETGCSLKLAFNVNMNNPEATYNWETSRIKRGINNERLFEMPSRYWADLSQKNWGISIIEDSKYGWDHPSEDTLRMTLLFTPALYLISGFRDQKSQDWGEHTIRYGIYAHESDFKGTDSLAKRFNQPIRTFKIKNNMNTEQGEDISLLEVSNKQIGILALKKSEDSDGLVIRLYERYGEDCEADIIFTSNLLDVKEVNGLEEPLKDIPFARNKFTANVTANSIHSYIVKLDSPKIAHNIRQESVKLEYNSKMIGRNGEKGGFFPKDITPPTIPAGLISYHLNSDELLNSVQCKGQTVSIPKGYNTLSILQSSSEDRTTSFKWLDRDGNVLSENQSHLSKMSGFVGQWDTRIWEKEPEHFLKNERDYIWKNKCVGIKPGHVNRDRIEWYASHTLKNGESQAYKYGYMFTITLNIPNDAISLVLPEDNHIYIMAMTVSQQSVKIKSTQYLRDKYDF